MKRSYNEKRDLYVALTRFNYFPNQKEHMGELPPCFSTRQFTPEINELIAALKKSTDREKKGFDLVEFRATRYNNVARTLSLIHPKAYSELTKIIIDNWDSLRHIADNTSSHITPEIRQDGRAFVMNYEDALAKKKRIIQSSFAKKVRIQTDIANCFNSVYSHSIPWAIIGLAEAKANRKRTSWFNQLDRCNSACKRGETLGIPIGPGTSSVIIEIILSTIDIHLQKKGYTFERYVDDYVCYCDSDNQSEAFIIDLDHMLADFKLSLNLNKTISSRLPSSSDDDWILELIGSLPHKKTINFGGEQFTGYFAHEALIFINQALKINANSSDGSVLKFAIQLITTKLSPCSAGVIFQEILNLSWHYPILIPFLNKLCINHEIDVSPYSEQLNTIIIESALKRRSDGMCWTLYLMYIRGLLPSEEAIEKVIKSKDCLSLTLIFKYQGYLQPMKPFVDTLIEGELYAKDNYWLLLYQLFLKNHIANPYKDDQTFNILKNQRVDFLPSYEETDAEKESDRVSDSMIFGPVQDFIDEYK